VSNAEFEGGCDGRGCGDCILLAKQPHLEVVSRKKQGERSKSTRNKKWRATMDPNG
jgi:hypothetical protein